MLETSQTQTRTEHSRSLEDAEQYKALEVLKEAGLLIPLSDLDVYHGRKWTSDESGEWEVDPTFSNGGNDSGNNNVNNRPTLYTAEREVAQEFADRRAGFRRIYYSHLRKLIDAYTPEQKQEQLDRQNAHMKQLWEESSKSYDLQQWDLEELERRNSFVEVHYLNDKLGKNYYEKFKQKYADQVRGDIHEIVSGDLDAVVLDLSFDSSKLTEENKAKCRDALKTLVIPITEGAPLAFEDRGATGSFVEALRSSGLRMVGSSDIKTLADDAGLKESTVLQMASAWNTRQFALTSPSFLARKLLESGSSIGDVVINEPDGEKKVIPINYEYMERYLRLHHIVGVKQEVYSATLGKSVDSVSLFDLEKVDTKNSLENKRAGIAARLGGIAASVGGLLHVNEAVSNQRLLRSLENPYAKPEELVSAARGVAGFEDVFMADTGNWEGFTLAEHTETVLRNFDETYADFVPVQLIAPMRLAILAHDLGKPIAVSDGQKGKQKEYNTEYAQKFFAELGIDSQLSMLLTAALGEGQAHAYMVDIRRAGESAEKSFHNFALSTLQNIYSADAVTREQVDGFTEFCSMLQVCDGGAYTNIAITRKDSGGRHRNAPSFNHSFQEPTTFSGRALRLKSKLGKTDKGGD